MLGKPVAESLLSAGYKVKIFTRNITKARQIFTDAYEFAAGNVSERDSLANALEGCYGVHVNLSGGPTPEDYDIIEHKGAMNTALAAKKCGVKRLTLITGASVHEGNIWYYATNAKYNAEKAVIGSGINYTIFRASWFMESVPHFITGKKARIIGKQTAPISWLAAKDYANIVTDSYSKPEAENKIFYVLGPEKFSMKDALERYIQKVAPQVKLKHMSVKPALLLGKLTRNPGLVDLANLMRFCEMSGKTIETGSGNETNQIFTPPSTTYDQWLEEQARV